MNIYFYLFLPLIIINSFCVILSKNSVTSVLYLISVFILVALNLLLVGVEFIAILLIIIYIGAISIPFLFVIMMLHLRLVEVYSSSLKIYPLGIFLGIFFFLAFYFLLRKDFFLVNYIGNNSIELNILEPSLIYSRTNIYLLGDLLLNYFSVFFIIGGLILLLAMIGSILLTKDNLESKEKKMDKNPVTLWSISR